MKRFACLSGFALLAALAAQQTNGRRARELAPGVFYWQGDRQTQRQTNVGWVVFGDYILVIDANFPWGARDILPEILGSSGKPIRFVFNTHYHADHAYGNVVFAETGATVVCTEACTEESRRKGPSDVQNQAKDRATEPLVHASLQFQDRLVFDDGGHRVELIRTGPAHSKGDAVAWLPKEKILFAGDLVVNWELGNNVGDSDADHAKWVRELDRLAAWNPTVVIPGHGVPGNLTTLQGQRAYLAAMLDGVLAGIRSQKTADQIAAEIDLSQHQPFGADPRRTASQVKTMHRLQVGIVKK